MKKKINIILVLLMVVGLFAISSKEVHANGIPYTTYTYSSSNKRFVATQDAYLPLSIQYDLGGIDIVSPQDITVDSKNNVYIVDDVLKIVIKYNLETDESQIIGEGVLEKPTGIHVGLDNKVYVTDLAKKEAYQFTMDENTNNYQLTNTYKKPTNTPYFDEKSVFEPTKIVTDHANIVYVVLAGSYNGLAKYNENAEFLGFFGGNQISATFENMIKTLLFDEEQRRSWFKMIPKSVYNVAVDQTGLILTTTKTEEGYKKLNIASQVYNESFWGFDNNEDIFVGPNKTIFVISNTGEIVEYSPEGEILFVFSGKDNYDQKGLFKTPTGIAVDSKNNIYAIDSQSKSLQIFIPTQFANTVHNAINLYYEGRYSESLEPWKEVLKMNSLFDLANKGIGDAYFAQMNYEKAMESYVISRDIEGYSQAYWEVRNKQLLNNGSVIIGIILGLVLLLILNSFFKITTIIFKPLVLLNGKLKNYKIYQELTFGFYIFKKPGDGFYGIKREKKSSNITAIILYALFFISYMFWKYNTSFLFNDVIASEINIGTEFILIFLPILLWVFSNYLIGSIKDGEGRLSNIFQGTAYILIPLIIAFPVVSIISNFLTLNEGFIYSVLLYSAIAVSVIYLVIMVKEIHFYDMKPTISNILITIFTAIMILVFVLIVYTLLTEVVGLFTDIIKEVSNRV